MKLVIKFLSTKYISYLLKKGDKYIDVKDSRKYHLKALKFAKRYRLIDDYAPIYLSIGVSHHINENYNQALIALNLAQKYPIDDMSYDLIIPLKLDILFVNEKYLEARKLAICSIKESNEKIYEVHLVLSEIYLALKNYHKAIIYGKESLKIAYYEQYQEGIEQALHNLIDIYRLIGDYDTALKYYDEIENFGLSEELPNLLVAKYNLLVTQKRYDEAKILIPKIEEKLEYEHESFLLHTFLGLTLELFKKLKDRDSFDIYFNKFLSLSINKDNYIEHWLAYSQAGDLYRKLQLNKEAIEHYKKMAYYLEKVRVSTLNRNSLDRVDFFKDKYTYLLGAFLFLYEQQEYNLAFYFLESSKSATLRDIILYDTLNIKDAQEIKEYM